MEIEIIKTGDYRVRYFSINTLIIGSGAASLKAAVSLHSLGQKDIVIATEKWGAGTSNNAGSDKQTYYKMSLSGDEPDSAAEMAGDLFNGRCMHGDIALCEAHESVRSFMKLVDLGVPFPRDRYGGWPGYKTDHDPRSRATSAGPYTSRMMFSALAGEVKRMGINVLDNHHFIALLTDRQKTKVIGAMAIDTSEEDPLNSFVVFNSTNVILGTGGPGGLYETSVYPLSQNGATGMAFAAGASGQNLTESQFGIASVKFRWNLSGSYQQVVPRYYSTDMNGDDEREFLNDHFPDYRSLTKAIFLKGYQWPFDPEKIEGYGSSMIDLLVFREREEKGRRVFIDFTKNLFRNRERSFLPENLDDTVYNYLSRSGALQETPVARLLAMNAPAVELYRDNGIDITSEPLEIAVCAQHNNGGLKAGIWWESDLKHLFPVGEVNGSHGVRRPGGSALNSGQVGGYRAAYYISRKYNSPPPGKKSFLAETGDGIGKLKDISTQWLISGNNGMTGMILSGIRKRMSAAAGILREKEKAGKEADEAKDLFNNIPKTIGAGSVKELADCFTLLGNCLSHYIYLEAIRTYIAMGGRSRGSYLVSDGIIPVIDEATGCLRNELCRYDREIEKNILVMRYLEGSLHHHLEEVREIPAGDLWFEKVWRDNLEDNLSES